MSDDRSEDPLARLQAVLTALLKHRLEESLGRLKESLEVWGAGELGPFEAHAEVLKHAARSERFASQIAQVGADSAGPVLRDAVDVGLLGEEEFVELVGCPPAEVEPLPVFDDAAIPQLPDKQEFVIELLETGAVLLHVDARCDGVDVPGRLRDDPKLVLRFGYGLAPAIADLLVDDDGISGTLTFGGVPHHCLLGWDAVYAAVSEETQQAMVWPDDVPPVVLEQMNSTGADAAAPARPVAEPAEQAPAKSRPTHLKLVD